LRDHSVFDTKIFRLNSFFINLFPTVKIFVSIASYCDPELLATISDAFKKAKFPDELRFGILDQSNVDLYDHLPPWRDQIRYVWMKARDARGVGFARSVIQGMVEDEDYLLQIDSHMRFDPHWDEVMISQMDQLPWKSILTASPMPWDHDRGPRRLPEGKTIKLLPHKLYPLRNAARIIDCDPEKGFVKGDRLAAGCLFSRGCLYDHIPYDPHLYFNGEEYTYAERAMAAGWSIYHPKSLPIFHLYKKSNESSDQLHWGKAVERYWDPSTLRAKGEKRIEDTLRGANGIYSIPSGNILAVQGLQVIGPQSLPGPSGRIAPEDHDLSPLFQDLLLVIYGTYSLLPKGRHSSLVCKLQFGSSVFVLKVSSSDSYKERTVSAALLDSVITQSGKSYACPAILLDIIAAHGHYMLYEYYDLVNMKSKSFKEVLDEPLIFRGIGEFNARNMTTKAYARVPIKKFALSLTQKRLKIRFPKVDDDALQQSLIRARKVNQMLLADVALHDERFYSVSHNDLHRGNMSIGHAGTAGNKVIFIDFSRLCWSPLGTDLQFIVYYLLRSNANSEKWRAVFSQYIQGFAPEHSANDIEFETVFKGAMYAYIDKWLNIHRRPASSHDWTIFNLCLDVSELFFNSDCDEFIAKVPGLTS
jgi:hypothetical protein